METPFGECTSSCVKTDFCEHARKRFNIRFAPRCVRMRRGLRRSFFKEIFQRDSSQRFFKDFLGKLRANYIKHARNPKFRIFQSVILSRFVDTYTEVCGPLVDRFK